MKLQKLLALLLVILFTRIEINAQSRLTVFVVDATTGEAIPFAPVTLSGQNQESSVLTNFDGMAILVIPKTKNPIIKCSSLGYETIEEELEDLKPNKKNEVVIKMESRVTQLDCIYIVDYAFCSLDGCCFMSSESRTTECYFSCGSCYRSSEIIEDDSVAIAEEPKTINTRISYFPNPTAEKINIQSTEVIGEISIHDCNGRLLRKLYENSGSISIDLSEYSSGLYLISTSAEPTPTKIIKN